MYFLVTDFWHEVRRVNTWVVWLACQGGGGGSYENEDPEDEDLRPPYENEDPLRKRRPPTKTKTPYENEDPHQNEDPSLKQVQKRLVSPLWTRWYQPLCTCSNNVSWFSWWVFVFVGVFVFVMGLRFRRGVLDLRFRNYRQGGQDVGWVCRQIVSKGARYNWS